MSYTLSELLQDAYKSLGQLQVAQAAGGSTSSVVDGNLSGGSKDDDWNGGTVIIISADGEAPEGEFGRVTDFAASSGTLTIKAVSAAVASGDVYGLASAYYPLRDMIEHANAALRELDDIPLADTTTLETAQSQTEYTAALTWKRRPPFRVDIQTRTDTANNHGWQPVNWWEYVPASPGSTGLLVFNRQLTAGRDLRVWYLDRHPRIDAYNDVVYEGIVPALAAAALVEMALRWQITRLEGENTFMLQRWNDAKNEVARMKELYPIWKPPQYAKMKLAGI